MEQIPERLTIRIDQEMQCELIEVARKDNWFHLSRFVRAAIRDKVAAWRIIQAAREARDQANLDKMNGKTKPSADCQTNPTIVAKPTKSKKRRSHVD